MSVPVTVSQGCEILERHRASSEPGIVGKVATGGGLTNSSVDFVIDSRWGGGKASPIDERNIERLNIQRA